MNRRNIVFLSIVSFFAFTSLSTANISTPLKKIPFSSLTQIIEKHPLIQAKQYGKEALVATGDASAYWKDPELRFEASNLPIEDPRFGITGMTGMQVMLSQTFPLSSKFNLAKEALYAQAKSVGYDSNTVKRQIMVAIWKNSIERQKLLDDILTYNDTMQWLSLAIDVAQSLYANGTGSQEALLALQIRKVQLESSLHSTQSSLLSLNASLSGILSSQAEIEISSIPWKYLEDYTRNNTVTETSEEKALQASIRSLALQEKAKKLQSIPDLTAGFAYRYRDNYDSTGDFFSVVLSIPLPLYGQRLAQIEAGTKTRLVAQEQLRDYTSKKNAKQKELLHTIQRVDTEIRILKNQTIIYAKTAKELVEQSYRVGEASYNELLDAEFRLLTFSINLNALIAQKRIMQTDYLFTVGASMNPI